MVPGEKRPAVKHYPWLRDLSAEAIVQHWQQNPDREVGAVLDDTHLLLDADTSEAEEALSRIERQFGIKPLLIVKTRRGHHHHYVLKHGTFVKADSHKTDEFPARIDVRAANSSVMLTPSRDKAVYKLEVNHRNELPLVGQDFVDAVFQHNGRDVPRPWAPDEDDDGPGTPTADVATVAQLLAYIDPDCGYDDWLHVLMAIFNATGGSDSGLELADGWSKKGESYEGRKQVEAKWRSFSLEVSNPVTVGTLITRARAGGAHVAAIMQPFEPFKTVVVQPSAIVVQKAKADPFAKYSLLGQSEKYEALAKAATPLLGEVCLLGEATVFYAKHNVGKTLLCFHLIMEAVKQGRISAGNVKYVNADDSSAGLATKLRIMDEIGVNTLVPGQSNFKIVELPEVLREAVEEGTARDTFVVLDTLKKSVDLMNKRESSVFGNVCREFVSAGGTLLALAHVNKNKIEGKAVHAGTTDILDDFDAGYILDELTLGGRPGEKVVEFTRLKARGGGVESAMYAYAAEDNVSYEERLASVRLVRAEDLENFKIAEKVRADSEVIAVVRACIAEGIILKMALRDEVADRTGISKREAIKVIDRYTGSLPGHHQWCFARGGHGSKVYSLLPDTAAAEGEATPAGG